MLNKLFRQDLYEGRYIAKPPHLLYAVLLLGVGTVTFIDWPIFATVTFILGAALGATIVLSMNWEKAIEYWETIERTAKTMMSIKDITIRNEIWKSMGYNFVPMQAEIIETRRDEHGVFQGMSRKILPFDPAHLQVVADKVLSSGVASFAEPRYKSIVPNYRKIQKELKTKGYIIKTKDGYVFNRKGIDMLYEYASESIKIELKRRKENEQ